MAQFDLDNEDSNCNRIVHADRRKGCPPFMLGYSVA